MTLNQGVLEDVKPVVMEVYSWKLKSPVLVGIEVYEHHLSSKFPHHRPRPDFVYLTCKKATLRSAVGRYSKIEGNMFIPQKYAAYALHASSRTAGSRLFIADINQTTYS